MSGSSLDPRLNPVRGDLAADHLRDQVSADRFAAGTRYQIRRASAPMRNAPDGKRGLLNEALFGETMIVYEMSNSWAWGQLERDSYVGYVPADALSQSIAEATDRVSAIGTFMYAEPDIKSQPVAHLSLNSMVAVAELTGNLARVETGGYIVQRHLMPKDRYARDFVEVAERLIGTPYLWGGRTRVGIDCSGLVQVAMEAAGQQCPRDSDMQQAHVGTSVLVPDSLDGLLRGDLVFWRGHVGIMTDGVMMVHANAHHMAVVSEPASVAAARIAKTGGPVVAVRRM